MKFSSTIIITQLLATGVLAAIIPPSAQLSQLTKRDVNDHDEGAQTGEISQLEDVFERIKRDVRIRKSKKTQTETQENDDEYDDVTYSSSASARTSSPTKSNAGATSTSTFTIYSGSNFGNEDNEDDEDDYYYEDDEDVYGSGAPTEYTEDVIFTPSGKFYWYGVDKFDGKDVYIAGYDAEFN
ncbi:unnamed protein product [Ambrosiozyma monospora]|uniref:Unnamed protein product n=1 Tax=Ambrosiozyma monospora TaxID=43982 RepID=A0ACB5T3T2_AMBMO|nr:unnamed protein product [Ambrosiozyma monospora]